MKKTLYFSLILIIFISSLQSCLAQEKTLSEPLVKLKGFSLLDPSRLKMNQSYTFSFFSTGKQSGTFGLYTNTLEYRISQPLLIKVGLAYLHQPLSIFNRGSQSLNGVLLPNFQLFYQPSKSFQLRIDVSSMPGWYEYWYR